MPLQHEAFELQADPAEPHDPLHAPPWQTMPVAQALPQAPQLFGSVDELTQTLLQRIPGGGQLEPPSEDPLLHPDPGWHRPPQPSPLPHGTPAHWGEHAAQTPAVQMPLQHEAFELHAEPGPLHATPPSLPPGVVHTPFWQT